MKRVANIAFVLAGITLGCATGGVAVQYATAQSPSPPNAQRWQQFCEFGTDDPEQFNLHLAKRGGEGYELVQVVKVGGLVCFKRPTP